jgi:hypothetical protein
VNAPEPADATSRTEPAAHPSAMVLTDAAPVEAAPASDKPHYWAWTDRWDPGTWETPDNPTALQRVLAGVALVIVLVMTVYVPLRILKIL